MTKPKTKKPTAHKSNVGRPKDGRNLGYDGPRVTVSARVTVQEAEIYDARAKALGLSVSEWLRTIARRDCGMWPHGEEPTTP